MASIDKRKGRSGYRVRWRDLSGIDRSRACPDHATAKALQRDIERCLALGRDWQPVATKPVPEVRGLEAIVELHLQARALEVGKSWLTTLAITWDQMLESLRETHKGQRLLPEHLTTSALRVFYIHCREVLGQSEDTAVTRVITVQNEWRLMWEAEDFAKDNIPPPRRLRLKRPPPAVLRPAPTWVQMDAVIQFAATDGDSLAWHKEERYRALVLGRALGLRHSQLLQVDWSDFDLQAATLLVRPELGKSRGERRGRIVPLPAWLVTEMSGWGARKGRVVRTDPSEESIHAAWAGAGVPEVVWRTRPFHALRHGFITGLRAAGVERELVSRLVGHASGTTTSDVYTDWRLLEGPLRQAVAHNPPPSITGQVVPFRKRG